MLVHSYLKTLCRNRIEECDVFGRTCFLFVIENVTHHEEELCPQCIEACSYQLYPKTGHHKAKMTSDDDSDSVSDYFKRYMHFCRQKAFCDYLLDPNNTFNVETWDQVLYRYRFGYDPMSKEKRIMNRFRDLIVVTIKFTSPTVEMIEMDVKYSIYDKIAGIGGTLGMYTQITGGSIIALLHFFALFIKAIYSHFMQK